MQLLAKELESFFPGKAGLSWFAMNVVLLRKLFYKLQQQADERSEKEKERDRERES